MLENELVNLMVKDVVGSFRLKEISTFTDLASLMSLFNSIKVNEEELTIEDEKKLIMELKSKKHIIIFEPTKIKLKKALENFLMDFPELLTQQTELVYTIILYKHGRTQFYGFITKPLRLNLTKQEKEKTNIGVLKLTDDYFDNTVYSFEEYQNLLRKAEAVKSKEIASKMFNANANNQLLSAAGEEITDKEFLDKLHQHPDIYAAFKSILASQDIISGDVRVLSYDVVDYIQTGSEGNVAIKPVYSSKCYLNTVLSRETLLKLLPTTMLYCNYYNFIYGADYQHYSVDELIYTVCDGVDFLEGLLGELDELE